ncbi:FRAS1-related extracellular matrix protein 2-like [Puntigrus tetrazona]|uniref:FRAS1-related extracellular matrix protein 2-like n=1 Tax=Puntigrus tetrazona TaxID=1606681 RepID=UPI001C8ABB39|nr:FRAS1-related extracellular matrix protein 2-like [Puntigrus tetrazona]
MDRYLLLCTGVRFELQVQCEVLQPPRFAQVMMDFNERSNTDISTIVFLPERVSIRASIGAQNETLIKIKDDADKAIISFGAAKFSVSEPSESGQISVVRIPVQRTGDTSKVSVVRVHTKDGSLPLEKITIPSLKMWSLKKERLSTLWKWKFCMMAYER